MFLSSELQAAQIVRSRQVSDKQGQSPVNQEFTAICETLKLPVPKGQEAAGVFSQLQNKVRLFKLQVISVRMSKNKAQFTDQNVCIVVAVCAILLW